MVSRTFKVPIISSCASIHKISILQYYDTIYASRVMVASIAGTPFHIAVMFEFDEIWYAVNLLVLFAHHIACARDYICDCHQETTVVCLLNTINKFASCCSDTGLPYHVAVAVNSNHPYIGSASPIVRYIASCLVVWCTANETSIRSCTPPHRTINHAHLISVCFLPYCIAILINPSESYIAIMSIGI